MIDSTPISASCGHDGSPHTTPIIITLDHVTSLELGPIRRGACLPGFFRRLSIFTESAEVQVLLTAEHAEELGACERVGFQDERREA